MAPPDYQVRESPLRTDTALRPFSRWSQQAPRPIVRYSQVAAVAASDHTLGELKCSSSCSAW